MRKYVQTRNGEVIGLLYGAPNENDTPWDSYNQVDEETAREISRDITKKLAEASHSQESQSSDFGPW